MNFITKIHCFIHGRTLLHKNKEYLLDANKMEENTVSVVAWNNIV